MVKISNTNDIQNYMVEYDARNKMCWGDFVNKIKALTQSYGFDPKGQVLGDLVTFIFMRKMLDPDFMVLSSVKAFSLKTYRIYFLTILRAFEVIEKMKNPPVKAALKLIIVFLELFARLSLTKKNFPDGKKITERRFELLKSQITPGMSDREIKQIIAEVTKLKDPKSMTKYLKKWRSWEKRLYESLT